MQKVTLPSSASTLSYELTINNQTVTNFTGIEIFVFYKTNMIT